MSDLYIHNLVMSLIRKNRYLDIAHQMESEAAFRKHVKIDLCAGDIRAMRPETLGKIMCAFEIGDVLASKEELSNQVTFSGDCEEFLRDLVSLCLAYAITKRLLNHGITW